MIKVIYLPAEREKRSRGSKSTVFCYNGLYVPIFVGMWRICISY